MLGNILFLFLALLGVQLVGNVAGAPSSATEIVPDLEGLSIGDIINALGIGLVQNITAIITLDSLTTNLIDIPFIHLSSNLFTFADLKTAKNPLIIELTLDKVSSIAGVNNTVYASFNHTFDPPVVVRPLETADSGTIDNVLLVQGAINSLNIIPLGELDLMDVNISVRAATIDGFGGIPIPINGLKQSDVPTT
ncbi:hypothetical protein EV361DRAFT_795041 [Lentinula raphanica]|uniref:Uncharacterized protein n=1 Tax=Lentinula raphanica TaxID=153919 RepID=A0AA38UF20_9AGAR|nr:hypothetical protein F5878DRAFT_536938 [Lentinula raphanica]KAJ3974042.1 hypothetical protein EV361DRAFT_795041 [Lentinula raphanica]